MESKKELLEQFTDKDFDKLETVFKNPDTLPPECTGTLAKFLVLISGDDPKEIDIDAVESLLSLSKNQHVTETLCRLLFESKKDSFKFPDDITVANDKVTWSLFEGGLSLNEPTTVKTKIHNPTVLVSLDGMESKDTLTTDILDKRARSVFNAICSVWKEGRKDFSAKNIVQILTHNKSDVSPYQEAEIDEIIKRFQFMPIYINYTSNNKEHTIRDYVLNVTTHAVTTHNQYGDSTTFHYYLNAEPPLLTHAESVNQIVHFPWYLDDIPINKDRDIIYIRDTMKLAISDMKNRNRNTSILYETLFSKVSFPDEPKAKAHKKNKLHTKVCKILDYWKEKKFIKGYEVKKDGNVTKGVKIIV